MVRAGLFFAALIVKFLLYLFKPPFFISSDPLIAPFSVLVALDILSAIVVAIILVECLRVIVYERLWLWGWKQQFVAVSTCFIVAIGVQIICLPQMSGRYY